MAGHLDTVDLVSGLVRQPQVPKLDRAVKITRTEEILRLLEKSDCLYAFIVKVVKSIVGLDDFVAEIVNNLELGFRPSQNISVARRIITSSAVL